MTTKELYVNKMEAAVYKNTNNAIVFLSFFSLAIYYFDEQWHYFEDGDMILRGI